MKKINVFGIIGAMDSEIEYLTSVISDKKTEEHYGLMFYTGNIGEKKVVVVKSGIGKVNASRCTQMLIDIYTPDVIINTGIAGALAPSLDVCDIVVADKLVQHDFDASGLGYVRGYACTGEDPSKPTYYYPDKDIIVKIKKAAEKYADGSKVIFGTIASGDLFVSSNKAKTEIRDLFSADAAEMEGAAIANTAYYSGVPFAVLRVMSDRADGNASISIKELEYKAANISGAVIKELICNE